MILVDRGPSLRGQSSQVTRRLNVLVGSGMVVVASLATC